MLPEEANTQDLVNRAKDTGLVLTPGAAFFAGLDFEAYQSHSIYFSRYPYGREATISWPAPDLEFTNTTSHPALIWTSYTDTSLTATHPGADRVYTVVFQPAVQSQALVLRCLPGQ